MAVVVVGLWTRWPSPWWLMGAAVLVALSAAGVGRRLTPLLGGSAVVLVAAVVTGFLGHSRLNRVALDWQAYRSQRAEVVGAALSRELDELIERGDEAADALAREGSDPSEEFGRRLTAVRKEWKMDAVAIYGPDGQLRHWDGVHRGPIPLEARLGSRKYVYGERPLFGYLYFTAPVEATGGAAVAATLLRSDLPPAVEADVGDLSSRFRKRTGERIVVTTGARGEADEIWDLEWEGKPLFSVALVEPRQADRLEEIRVRWMRPVALGVVAAWLFLALGARGGVGHRVRSAGTLVILACVLPLGSLLGLTRAFSPADFLLPGPVEVTLGRLLAVALAGAVGMGVLSPRWPGFGRPWLGAGLVALAFPLILQGLRRSPSLDFLAGPEWGWVAYQSVAALLLALVGAVAIHLSRTRDGDRGPVLGQLMAGLVLTGLAAFATAVRVEMSPRLPWWVFLAWTVPAVSLARGVGGGRGTRPAFLTWGAAILLGTSVALPVSWGDRIAARMTVAEEEVEALGRQADPFLEFLLHRFGAGLHAVAASGAAPVEVLYRGWVDSGLADEGYPVWLTFWAPDGAPGEDLRLGIEGPRPREVRGALAAAPEAGRDTVLRFDAADVRYIGVASLHGGARVTALIPPRHLPGRASTLEALLAPSNPRGDPLTLVRVADGEDVPASDTVRWTRAGEGRLAELYLDSPEGIYHAHYEMELPGPLLETARAVLLIVLNVFAFGLLLILGHLAVSRLPARPWDLAGIVGSFRSRLTLTLFGFFLVPTLVFGTLAYRTLTGASLRTATALAERSVEEAVDRVGETGEDMDILARRVGANLLLYRSAAIAGGSVDELVELGLYQGWLPPEVHQVLSARQEVLTTSTSSLGGWDYVVAYRRLPGGEVLAAPASLEAGATALRRGEVTHLLAFATVLGAALSVLLSLLAGRTLYRPIQTLQVASERVGTGNLGVRLPDHRRDEFGSVFAAFNRMVLRLRRARRALVRTTRRTQAIVEEAATGVVALDAQGRVTLVNPRAEALVGTDVEVGEALPTGGGPWDELVRWVELYLRDGLEEAGAELQIRDRRIRVRARRISRGEGPLGGAVLSLEDVTDELRSERILAWGEMARQVAHEVKNPLTPIQLGVQHIRRAWEDGRPDFETILTSNVESILGEIERLAGIARSFSRFGAPESLGGQPLERVLGHAVVKEVLALYATGQTSIHFVNRVPRDLPPLRCRESELKEVLVNLLENARVAVAEGGTVAVEGEGTGGGMVELRVRDDGAGIGPELLARVFEPHFSTRSTGTGLGLAIVRRLVESWGGSVAAESQVGHGTVVRVHIPCWERVGGGTEASDS